MQQKKQIPKRPRFDSSGIGLVPIGFPGEYGFFVDSDLSQETISHGDFI